MISARPAALIQSRVRRTPLLLLALAALLATAMLSAPPPAQAQAAPAVPSVAFTSSTGTDNTYAIGDTISGTVTISVAVDVTGTPQLELDVGGAPPQACYSSGTSTPQLVFTCEVVENDEDTEGLSISADKLGRSSGTIKTGVTLANLDHAAGHNAEAVLPTLTRAETSTDGTKNLRTHSEDLSEGGKTLSPFFTAKVDGTEANLGGQVLVPIVTLTLASPSTATQTLTLSYGVQKHKQ